MYHIFFSITPKYLSHLWGALNYLFQKGIFYKFNLRKHKYTYSTTHCNTSCLLITSFFFWENKPTTRTYTHMFMYLYNKYSKFNEVSFSLYRMRAKKKENTKIICIQRIHHFSFNNTHEHISYYYSHRNILHIFVYVPVREEISYILLCWCVLGVHIICIGNSYYTFLDNVLYIYVVKHDMSIFSNLKKHYIKLYPRPCIIMSLFIYTQKDRILIIYYSSSFIIHTYILVYI